MRLPTAIVAALLAAMVLAAPSRAQDATGATYITPFPENDTYRMLVIGDSFATGILGGLMEAFAGDDRLQLQRRTRPIYGLARADAEDDIRQLEDPGWRDVPHIAIVMIGATDRTSMRGQGGRRVAVGSPEWRDVYGQRIDRLMKALKRRKIAVYWVGLPIMRRADWNEDVQTINEMVLEKAYLNGVKLIDAYASFADENGNYSAYGPDIAGKIRLLREGDGVHFTETGNRKLAHFVERDVRRDLAQAKAERSIPLLGSEQEQQRIAAIARPAATPRAAAPGLARPAVAASLAKGVDQLNEQKTDNSRISLRIIGARGKEEAVVVDVLRPAISANVVALVTRRQSSERAAQMGDTLVDEIAGGLLVMNSVTPFGDLSGRRRLPPTQTPFFRVLVKGERLPPKPGRADDFTWPRPEPPALESEHRFLRPAPRQRPIMPRS